MATFSDGSAMPHDLTDAGELCNELHPFDDDAFLRCVLGSSSGGAGQAAPSPRTTTATTFNEETPHRTGSTTSVAPQMTGSTVGSMAPDPYELITDAAELCLELHPFDDDAFLRCVLEGSSGSPAQAAPSTSATNPPERPFQEPSFAILASIDCVEDGLVATVGVRNTGSAAFEVGQTGVSLDGHAVLTVYLGYPGPLVPPGETFSHTETIRVSEDAFPELVEGFEVLVYADVVVGSSAYPQEISTECE
jgi:hypothetical protein